MEFKTFRLLVILKFEMSYKEELFIITGILF
jgi:hypothetical protein